MKAPEGFVQVAAASQLQADLMQAVLQAGAIPVFALNAGESLFAGMGENSVSVALYVPEDQAERARQLLAAGEGNAD